MLHNAGMSSKTLLLVDGSSYLYRAYHALPDLRSPTAFPRVRCTAWSRCSSGRCRT